MNPYIKQVWDRATGNLIADLKGGHNGKVFCVAADCTKVRLFVGVRSISNSFSFHRLFHAGRIWYVSGLGLHHRSN